MMCLKLSALDKDKELNDMGVAKMKLDESFSHLYIEVIFLIYSHYRAFLALSSSQPKKVQKWQMTKVSLKTSSISCACCLHQLIKTKAERNSSSYTTWLAFM